MTWKFDLTDRLLGIENRVLSKDLNDCEFKVDILLDWLSSNALVFSLYICLGTIKSISHYN